MFKVFMNAGSVMKANEGRRARRAVALTSVYRWVHYWAHPWRRATYQGYQA